MEKHFVNLKKFHRGQKITLPEYILNCWSVLLCLIFKWTLCFFFYVQTVTYSLHLNTYLVWLCSVVLTTTFSKNHPEPSPAPSWMTLTFVNSPRSTALSSKISRWNENSQKIKFCKVKILHKKFSNQILDLLFKIQQ